MAASQPETVVLVTPHGHRVDGVFSLLNNARVRGELGPEADGTGNSLSEVPTYFGMMCVAYTSPTMYPQEQPERD